MHGGFLGVFFGSGFVFLFFFLNSTGKLKKTTGPHEGIPYLLLAFNFHKEEDPVDA